MIFENLKYREVAHNLHYFIAKHPFSLFPLIEFLKRNKILFIVVPYG